jgi:hypothetical protein
VDVDKFGCLFLSNIENFKISYSLLISGNLIYEIPNGIFNKLKTLNRLVINDINTYIFPNDIPNNLESLSITHNSKQLP